MEKLKRFAKVLGLRVALHKSMFRVPHQWDRDGVLRVLHHRDANTSNVAHEIGHWLVATPAQRRYIDFGLGTSPDSYKDTKRVLRAGPAQQMEELASVAGMLVELACGLDPYEYTWGYHNWENARGTGGIGVMRYVLMLEERGVMKRIKAIARRI